MTKSGLAYASGETFMYITDPFYVLPLALIKTSSIARVEMTSGAPSTINTSPDYTEFPSQFANQKVEMSTLTSSNPTAGSGTMLVKIWYTVITPGTLL